MSNKRRCDVCLTNFTKYSNLKRHVEKFHPRDLDEIIVQKDKKCAAICNECSQTFCKYSNLTRHVQKFHKDKEETLLSPKIYDYRCEKCSKHFVRLLNYKKHMKTHQEKPSRTSKISFKCTLCSHTGSRSSQLLKHFKEMHDISVSSETLAFPTGAAFAEWKCDKERMTNSRFVKQRGTQNSKITNYKCHRSGFYKSKGKGIRHLKSQGSNKMNGFCPAHMRLRSYDSGSCEVVFTKTHVGHDNDLGHINLTSRERLDIASKIAQKIPFRAILDEIRDSVTNCELERLHLLTRNDLWNIEQSFKLNNEAVRHKNDAVSVESWVSEMEGNGSVLFYKAQDTVCEEYPHLQKEDFILIIMTEGQLDLLQKYGTDCICIDSTHGINEYQFELTTLLILDDVREGFPCGFLISNKTDEETMKIFFLHVREKLGKQLQSTTFMSDMAASFYNAWIQVMLPAKYRLFCTWHVDRAWRKNINAKIVSKEERASVYKDLRTILQERDVNAFEVMITNFVQSLLSNDSTAEFGQYFRAHYFCTIRSWAFCFRLNAGLNTNMHIERMHRTIKYLYLNGKHCKRLDKAINAIMKFTKDKLFERLIILSKGKISTKIKDIRARHKTSKVLDMSTVWPLENGWQVPSSSTNEIYIIQEIKSNCECKLLCTDCDVCLHRYSCTCMDCCIRWNMCKHIHLVCEFRKMCAEPTDDAQMYLTSGEGEDPLVIDGSKFSNKEEEAAIIKSVTKYKEVDTDVAETLHSRQEKLITLFTENIRNTISLEEIEAVEKIVAPINPTVMSIRKEIGSVQLHRKEPSTKTNKNIEPQRRLFKTKKVVRNVGRNTCSLRKPESDEADQIAFRLSQSSSSTTGDRL